MDKSNPCGPNELYTVSRNGNGKLGAPEATSISQKLMSPEPFVEMRRKLLMAESVKVKSPFVKLIASGIIEVRDDRLAGRAEATVNDHEMLHAGGQLYPPLKMLKGLPV